MVTFLLTFWSEVQFKTKFYINFTYLFALSLYIYLTFPPWAGYDGTKSIFQQSNADLNSEFSSSRIYYCIKVEERSLPYYLSITLAQSKIQTASHRIWTLVTRSISYNNNHSTCALMLQKVIDFDGMSTHLGLFYAKRLGNCMHHHHRVMPLAWISLTLSRHFYFWSSFWRFLAHSHIIASIFIKYK